MNNTPKFINGKTLKEIRNNIDRAALFHALNIKITKTNGTEWWASSPLSEDQTPSFHMQKNFSWYDHSTNTGGGPIELVQAVFQEVYGKPKNCYEAGRWLLEQRVSFLGPSSSLPQGARSEGKRLAPAPPERATNALQKPKNTPIQYDLRPLLTFHPEFTQRGISKNTCHYLGAGHLDRPNSPLHERIVFQVRGLSASKKEKHPIILTHIGRATTTTQEKARGKWCFYKGFHKSLELYNLDHLLLDPVAIKQAQSTNQVIITEGAFDIAKLIEADIKNAVSTFGSHLCEEQIPRILQIADTLNIRHFLLWYDRDEAGQAGMDKAALLLKQNGFTTDFFNWQAFSGEEKDICECSVEKIRSLL